jgi:hypothetical protein
MQKKLSRKRSNIGFIWVKLSYEAKKGNKKCLNSSYGTKYVHKVLNLTLNVVFFIVHSKVDGSNLAFCAWGRFFDTNWVLSEVVNHKGLVFTGGSTQLKHVLFSFKKHWRYVYVHFGLCSSVEGNKKVTISVDFDWISPVFFMFNMSWSIKNLEISIFKKLILFFSSCTLYTIISLTRQEVNLQVFEVWWKVITLQ